jgi:hypothetical protein
MPDERRQTCGRVVAHEYVDVVAENSLRMHVDSPASPSLVDHLAQDRDIVTPNHWLAAPGMPRDVSEQTKRLVH